MPLADKNARRKYNVEYHARKQLGLCGICGKLLPLSGSGRHLDHDHVTSKLRGFLCRTCNLGLGHFKDSFELLTSALKYLQNPPAGIL